MHVITWKNYKPSKLLLSYALNLQKDDCMQGLWEGIVWYFLFSNPELEVNN